MAIIRDNRATAGANAGSSAPRPAGISGSLMVAPSQMRRCSDRCGYYRPIR